MVKLAELLHRSKPDTNVKLTTLWGGFRGNNQGLDKAEHSSTCATGTTTGPLNACLLRCDISSLQESPGENSSSLVTSQTSETKGQNHISQLSNAHPST